MQSTFIFYQGAHQNHKVDVEHTDGEIYKKTEHPNSHHLDGKHVAKIMNEDDRKRNISLT